MRPYYEDPAVTIYHGDCRDLLPLLESADAMIADPPYAETRLDWDQWPMGWPQLAAEKTRSLWCFGTLKMFWAHKGEFDGWSVAQDVIWEKQNGSSLHNDRFRKVHEQIVQFYSGEWASIYKAPVMVMDAEARSVRRQRKPSHWGQLGQTGNFSVEENGPRLERSVIYAKNMHRRCLNETQKPERIIRPLVMYSVPEGGLVIDPFGGSGTVARIAKDLGRRCVMIEKREAQCEIAANRLQQEVLSLAQGGLDKPSEKQ